MIKIKLSEEEKKKLEKFRGQSSSELSEKSLMILMSSEGKSPIVIAHELKRNPHTVRKWLKQYIKQREKGLRRAYSPGRPSVLRQKTQEFLAKIIEISPATLGYEVGLWTVRLLVHYLKTSEQLDVSEDTVERALKDMNYTYKRPSKSMTESAPSKKEKLEKVNLIIAEIMELQRQHETEVFSLDESHFSTQPYLVRGWQKKKWPPENTMPSKKGVYHVLWLLESENTKILLEKIEKR